MSKLINEKNLPLFIRAAEEYGTPVYVYDEAILREKCENVLSMPHAFGLQVRYAMKANSNRSLLKIIDSTGISIDASSLNEALRAEMAGIVPDKIMLTTQEVPSGQARASLERLMLLGMKYNVCSLRQIYEIADFAAENKIELSMRVHPGVGSGESATRNTGDDYSCFGVHISNIEQALDFAREKGLVFTQMHAHIGSGADPQVWRDNIDRELDLLGKHFPDAVTISFGGGLKEARMPEEQASDIRDLGFYAKERVEDFYERTGRKLLTEVEPGTYLLANSGFVLTRIVDKKRTGDKGFLFLLADGGMEVNTRPLLYGSRHPFYVLSKDGRLLSSEFESESLEGCEDMVVVGVCCESGDSQSLDELGNILPRKMAEPDVGDFLIVGGAGAYCSSMSVFNYNSHTQIPEVLIEKEGGLRLIRKRQTLEQIVENEV